MKWNTIINYSDVIKGLDILKDRDSIISLIGGEPTLHPKFSKILEHVRDFKNEMHIYTNGTTRFFNNIDLGIAVDFTWTFSYHGDETDDALFMNNITKMINNKVKVELTIPAQNINEKIMNFINKYKIKTVITFIHETSNNKESISIPRHVFNISKPYIKNMSRYSEEDVSYTGQLCDYSEVDIVSGFMYSNDCNHNINDALNSINVDRIYNLNKTVCSREFCKKDCAFLLPKKEVIENFFE